MKKNMKLSSNLTKPGKALSFIGFVICSLLCTPVFAQSPLDLLPPNQATHTVLNSGDWTNPNTWDTGAPPNNLAKVYIPAGKTLTVDSEISTRIKIIRNDGVLRFSPTSNTALKVETIVQGMMSELEIGTASNPIPHGITCKITIIDESNLDISSAQWEKGLVLMGKTVAYGAAKTSWLSLAVNPDIGATNLSLASVPNGWEEGDRIVITGVSAVDAASDEVATIQSINGNNITLTQALTKTHIPPFSDLRVHVANLSRNIIIESESPLSNNGLDRGHIMFMHTLDVDINFLKTHKMGRSRKDVPINDWFIGEDDDFEDGPRTNIRGRYSIHFHRGGVNSSLTPAQVKGCVVEDDPGWAFTNHSAYVNFDNNISYDVIGGGFQTEAGDELGAFTNNIAIRTVNPDYPIRLPFPENAPDTREDAQDFAFQGDGFWIHGGGVAVSGNVASGCSGHGFIYWPEGLIEPGFPTGTFRNTYVPSNLGLSNNINPSEPGVLATGWYSITNFQDNEAYSAGVGLATYYLHTTFFYDEEDYDPNYIATVHSTFDGFTAWNIDQQGIQLHFTERVTLKNITLLNSDGDASKTGIWASHYRAKNKQIFENIFIEGFGTGFAMPTQGQVTVTCGYLKNGINMYIPAVGLAPRDMLIHDVTTALDEAFSNPLDIKMETNFSSPGDKFPAYFLLPDKIILDYGPYNNQRLFFDEQAADYTPLPIDADPYTFEEDERVILAQFATKTNLKLQSDYQMSFGGTLLPANASTVQGIIGGKIHPWQNETLNIPVCIDAAHEFDIEEINECIEEAGASIVQEALASYNHPTSSCTTTDAKSYTDIPQNDVVIYPNPTTGRISISTSHGRYNIDIINSDGALIKTLNATGSIIDINISSIPAGLYLIKVHNVNNGSMSLEKLMKVE